MGYFAGTPEAHQARLGRKDSKNFATTCRGINTATGKQCRRGLSKSPNAPTSGIVTFVNGEETFFCWQHKEQAKDMVMKHTSSWQVRREQAGRTSLDTLVETVEVMVGTSSSGGRNGRTPVIAATATATAASGRKDSVGLLAVGPEAAKISPSSLLSNPSSPPSASGPRPRNSFLSFLAMLFSSCFGSRKKKRNPNLFPDATYSALAIIPEDGGTNHTKHTKPGRKNRLSNQHVQFDTTPMGPPLPHMSATKPMPSAMATTPYHGGGFQGKPGTTSITHQRPPLFSAIPKHLSPKTALLLQQELLKPFSSSDQPGYIYIFWLQDKPTGADPLQDTSPSTDKGKRRSSAPTNLDEAMDATASNSKGTSKRILFKIGRAANVQRRLHQWTTQCNYDLSLVRYYPYVSPNSTLQKPLQQQPTNTPLATEPRKVPNVNKIERLIHLELRGDPLASPPELSNPCKVCGRKHKEWFSIEASREGIRGVDELVKRWIKWGEDNADLYSGTSSGNHHNGHIPALAVSPRVDRLATTTTSSKGKGKAEAPVVGVVGPATNEASRSLARARKNLNANPRKRTEDEEVDDDYEYESESDGEWVATARVRNDATALKKIKVYQDRS